MPASHTLFTFLISAVLFSSAALAQDNLKETLEKTSEVSTIEVHANTQDGVKKEEINRVEAVSKEKIEKKQAQTFSQAIDGEKGVDAQTSCAFCGVKRITINGLKGEHTNILVDGLSLHSTFSGFYGVDAIPLQGIDSIDIYRGAGNALAYPEAIGGVLNVNTKEIIGNEVQALLRWSDLTEKNAAVLGTTTINEKTGLLLGVQAGEISSYDHDKNGVTEFPYQQTQSFLTKLQYQLTPSTELSLRLSHANLNNIGGNPDPLTLSGPANRLADSSDFEGRDVRRRYIADPTSITDNIQIRRAEAALIANTNLNESTSLKIALGSAWQSQDAIYSHGYDYNNKDQLATGLAEFQKILTADFFVTAGLDFKTEGMTSESTRLYQDLGLKKDNLNFQSTALYLQSTWLLADQDEVSLALRYDRLQTDWTDIGQSLNEDIWAPRATYKHVHNGVFTSRLGAGLGYRAPLTLFESQHGTTHDGFLINIRKLERAPSLTYSLNGQREDDFFEIGTQLTYLQNMAYGLDRADTDEATVFQNSDEDYLISVIDLSYDRRLTSNWTVEGIIESFDYPASYKAKLPVAAIERRLTVQSILEFGKWSATQKLTVIGERNLAEYGYGDHYNVAYTGDDVFDPDTFGKTVVSDPKFQKAPTYFTLDVSVHRHLNNELQLGLSILNAFDYTQASAGDTPTTWDLHGDHYHLDNFHIWGPLRGRQIYLSLSGNYSL